MHSAIKLLSIDFDGTLVSRVSEPVLDTQCMELIRELQRAGAIWAINTGRSVDLLESGLADFAFPIRPDFILTTEGERLEGFVAENDEEMERITMFIERARARHPNLDYQRNTVYLRFCHADYHKGAALAELARLLEIPRENIFASGDHHNDI